MDWKVHGRKLSCPNAWYYLINCVQKLRKTKNTQYNWSLPLGRGLNRGHTGYEANLISRLEDSFVIY